MSNYKMIALDGKVPLSSIVKNNILLLQNYVNDGHMGELMINMHPNQKRAVIIFTAAHESINLNGVQMYLDSISNEMQMDNGMSYIVGNETSEYDLHQFTDTIRAIYPEIINSVNNVTGLENIKTPTQTPEIPTLTAGVEDSTVNIPPVQETKVTQEMIYTMLVSMHSMLGEMKQAIDTLATAKGVHSVQPTEEPAVPKEQIPEAIKDNDIDPEKDTPAAEVATPNSAAVPDNTIQPPPQAVVQSNNVEEVKITPEVQTDVLNNEEVDSTTPTSGTESNTIPEGPLGEIVTFINSLKGTLPGIESVDQMEAENAVNNYIISNVAHGTIPSNITKLFNEYFFIESISSGELIPLDRVTQVRRQLSTNQYL